MKPEAFLHPKVRRLARRLHLEAWGARGIVESLWLWAADVAAQGDVGRFSDDDIAEAIGWLQRPVDELIEGLIAERLFERQPDPVRLVIHDWRDHCPDAVHMRLARAGLRFWDGSIPKLHRFSEKERGRILTTRYGVRTDGSTVRTESGTERTDDDSERTTSAQQAHTVRSDRQSVRNPPPLPSDPLPATGERSVRPLLDVSQATGAEPVSAENALTLVPTNGMGPLGLEAGFERFWALYPKRKSRGDAERAWRQLRPSRPLLELMLEAIAIAKESAGWLRDGGQFIPYPATWLRAKGWLDEETVLPVLSQKTIGNALAAEEFARILEARERGRLEHDEP